MEGEGSAPAPEVESPEDDPLSTETEGGYKRGLLASLNPLNWFGKPTPDKFINEGKEFLERGALAQATVAFQTAAKIDPGCVAAYRGMGKVFFKKGGRSNLEIALGHYQQAIKADPKEHDLYAITAKIYEAMGKRKEATLERKKFVIIRALESDPKNSVANNNMGILFLQQDKVEDAIEYFKKSIDRNKHFDIAYRNLAATYYQIAKNHANVEKKGQYLRMAREEVEKALAIQENVPSFLAYGRILLQVADYEKALECAEKADLIQAANKDVFLLKKVALERLGRFDEARRAFESYQIFQKAEAESGE